MSVPRKRKSARPSVRGGTQATPSDSRRRDIVDHAVRLMEERGFSAVSVQHLADALEFSKANFYHHLDSKEKLLHEIFVEILQFSSRQIEDIVNGQDSIPDKFRTLIAFYVTLMTERRAVMLVWFKERAHLTDSHLTEVSQLERQITGALERFYAQGIAEGYFKPMDTTVLRLAVFGMCFLLTKLPEHPKRPSAAVITRQLQQFATTGLLAYPDA